MISTEATREGGRSKLWTRFSQNPYGKKLPNLYQSSGVIGSVECPTRITEKIAVRCSGPLERFSNSCPVLKNSQEVTEGQGEYS